MHIAVGADAQNATTNVLVSELVQRAHTVELHGALSSHADARWPVVAESVAQRVSSRECTQGVLLCWTGTGVSIAANKVVGIRAALCIDAETARGARAYNDANILCLSLRLTSEAVVSEILDAWFSASIDFEEHGNIAYVAHIEKINMD